jgi:hypothetical protein
MTSDIQVFFKELVLAASPREKHAHPAAALAGRVTLVALALIAIGGIVAMALLCSPVVAYAFTGGACLAFVIGSTIHQILSSLAVEKERKDLIARARQACEAGNFPEARALFDQADDLDPAHPAMRDVARYPDVARTARGKRWAELCQPGMLSVLENELAAEKKGA